MRRNQREYPLPMGNKKGHQHKFDLRAMEHHHGLDLDPAGKASQENLCADIKRGSELGFNAIFLGETWPWGLNRLLTYSWDEKLSDEINQEEVLLRREAFSMIVKCADDHDVRIYGLYHPVALPKGFLEVYPRTAAKEPQGWGRQLTSKPLPKPVCPRHIDVKKMMQGQMKELLEISGVEGISCWLNQSDSRFFDCGCDDCVDQKIDESITELSQWLYEPCAKAGAELNIRTYLGSWQCGMETVCFESVHQKLNPKIRLTYKQQQGDMYNLHPFNPLIGKLSGRPQAIEFDVYGEYRGASLGLMTSVRHQIKEGVTIARRQGVDSIAIRGIHGEHPFSVDATCMASLMKDETVDVDQIALERLKPFGKSAKNILNMMDASWEVLRKCMYIKKIFWASWSVPEGLDRLRFILFDRSAPCVPGAFESLKVDDSLLNETMRNLAEAVALATSLPNIVDEGCRHLEKQDHDAVAESVKVCVIYAKMCEKLVPAFLKAFRWEACVGATMREHFRLELLEVVAQAHKEIDQAEASFLKIEGQALKPLMDPMGIDNQSPSARLKTPVVNARQICFDIEKLIDRSPTSFTGVAPWPARWPEGMSRKSYGVESS